MRECVEVKSQRAWVETSIGPIPHHLYEANGLRIWCPVMVATVTVVRNGQRVTDVLLGRDSLPVPERRHGRLAYALPGGGVYIPTDPA